MTQTDSQPTVQFDVFTFTEASGELTGPEGGGAKSQRLPPQPAKLLGYLIRRQPEIASLEEIRDLLWPDVQVEFEKSLHTCVRKIRAALGDSASEPRFVETVPRRGYRFLVQAHAVAPKPGPDEAASDESIRAHSPPRPGADRGTPRWRLTAAFAAAALALLAPVLWQVTRAPASRATKVAIMPFEPISSPSALSPNNGFAEALVAELVGTNGTSLDVIGPTTSQAYPEHTGALGQWIESDGIDYVINGRELLPDGKPRVLVEIIRGRDGAHVWAQYMDQLPDGTPGAGVIAEALADEIAHPRQRKP